MDRLKLSKWEVVLGAPDVGSDNELSGVLFDDV